MSLQFISTQIARINKCEKMQSKECGSSGKLKLFCFTGEDITRCVHPPFFFFIKKKKGGWTHLVISSPVKQKSFSFPELPHSLLCIFSHLFILAICVDMNWSDIYCDITCFRIWQWDFWLSMGLFGVLSIYF